MRQYFAHESLVTMPRVAPSSGEGAAARPAPPPAGTPLADLSIPRVHLSAVVLHGSDARTLSVGAGHIENTAFPGEPGNVAIAGHRDSFFRPLRHVRVGDEVYLETPQGRLGYRVTSLRVVPPTDVSVLEPTPRRDADAGDLLPVLDLWPRAGSLHRARHPCLRYPGRRLRRRRSRATSLPSPQPDAKRAGAADNDVLVRQAIERFRLVYNARFTRVGQEPLGGSLVFTGCRIAIDGERATATCETGHGVSDDVEVQARTFSLQKVNGAWAIKSFAVFP